MRITYIAAFVVAVVTSFVQPASAQPTGTSYTLLSQIDRFSALTADPSIREEDKSQRIVQQLDQRTKVMVVVQTFFAVGGNSSDQTLALFQESFTTPGKYVLLGYLEEAGTRGLRTILRVVPRLGFPKTARDATSFFVEAIDDDRDSTSYQKIVRVRFEYQGQHVFATGS